MILTIRNQRSVIAYNIGHITLSLRYEKKSLKKVIVNYITILYSGWTQKRTCTERVHKRERLYIFFSMNSPAKTTKGILGC